ncbi:FAD-binding monooxygenase [Streptomyces inusitatus]|uniref:FAD-binding monooxygenase n=1 Tax=Streptomyces inusitatus TaxID=68221 RepID=A0A918Q7S8_9ACTN|nr:FAD-dependent monooxygenase [Streptomyces inusitatus]GGZ35961.1 FAD-binding monooxygenase [Streptomyces inusitatus]
MTRRCGRHAVVLGAGMAGLLAARVLSDAYTAVTVVDRDTLTDVTDPRRGVPQGRQVHGLLARGQQIIEELFPGLTEEMVSDGANLGDVAGDLRWYINGVRLRRSRSGLNTLTSSRPFLESHVRARVQALPNVEFLERRDIIRLNATEDRGRIDGVVVADRDGTEELIEADLVLDASGRGSRTSARLVELGYPQVEEERRKIGLGYTTRHYRMRTDPYRGDIAINIMASAALPRGAIAAKVDGDRTVVTAYGILGDHPPADPEGFHDFIASVAAPDIHDALQDAEPLDDPVAYRFPVSLRRRYERMTRFPRGLLLMGDAVSSLNPSYAQGMTVSALEAVTLRRHLARGREPEPLPYLRDLAADAIDRVWELMIGSDLAYPGVEGERTPAIRFGHTYVGLVQRAGTRDPVVADAFLRVIALVEPSESLMRPALMLRVLRHVLGGSSARPAGRPGTVKKGAPTP